MNPIDHKLLRHVRERSTEDRVSGCWLWTLSANGSSYSNVVRFASHFAGGDGANQNAHRLAYRAVFGEIPDHLEIDHLCGRKTCCNPYHLQPVDHSTNIQRSRVAERHPLSEFWFAMDLNVVAPPVSDTGVI